MRKNIPKEWKEVKLGECLLKKPDYGINAPSVEYSESLPLYLRITDISDDGRFLHTKKTSVNHPFSKNYILDKDDLVFARTGASVGKTYLYNEEDGELVFAGFLIRVKLNRDKLRPAFLNAYTHTENYFQWVKETSTRSGQPGLNSVEYSNLELSIPSLVEQDCIVSVLETWDRAVQKVTAKIDLKKKIKQVLVRELLTGKMRIPGFKDDWKTVQLQEVCDIKMGQSPSSIYYNETGAGLPLIQGNNDIQNRKTIARIYTTQITKTAKKEDMIMTVRAPVGCIGVASTDVCIGRGVCSIRPIKVNKIYILQLLESYENRWKSFEQGSTFTAVNSSDVKALSLTMPSSENEQLAIANILWSISEEITLLEKKLRLLLAQKTYLLNGLVTGSIRTPERITAYLA